MTDQNSTQRPMHTRNGEEFWTPGVEFGEAVPWVPVTRWEACGGGKRVGIRGTSGALAVGHTNKLWWTRRCRREPIEGTRPLACAGVVRFACVRTASS